MLYHLYLTRYLCFALRQIFYQVMFRKDKPIYDYLFRATTLKDGLVQLRDAG